MSLVLKGQYSVANYEVVCHLCYFLDAKTLLSYFQKQPLTKQATL